jgi:hypothetical protein
VRIKSETARANALKNKGTAKANAELSKVKISKVKKETYKESFEDCWREYPARNGKKLEKKKASVEYDKAISGGIDIVDMFSYVESYAKSKPEFPKDMFRWIRDKNWEDDNTKSFNIKEMTI